MLYSPQPGDEDTAYHPARLEMKLNNQSSTVPISVRDSVVRKEGAGIPLQPFCHDSGSAHLQFGLCGGVSSMSHPVRDVCSIRQQLCQNHPNEVSLDNQNCLMEVLRMSCSSRECKGKLLFYFTEWWHLIFWLNNTHFMHMSRPWTDKIGGISCTKPVNIQSLCLSSLGVLEGDGLNWWSAPSIFRVIAEYDSAENCSIKATAGTKWVTNRKDGSHWKRIWKVISNVTERMDYYWL